ncbi:kinase-like domain-containing protein [Xylariaceae sp. FL0662B]|nr:kinase-like domain-containing protein [Xylariaceae sp. FL0662B]
MSDDYIAGLSRDAQYLRKMQAHAVNFAHFRTHNTNQLPFDIEMYPMWDQVKFPLRSKQSGDRVNVIQRYPTEWVRDPIARTVRPDLDQVANVQELRDSSSAAAWSKLQKVKDAFKGFDYRYQKTMGYGGNGICIHYKYDGDEPGRPPNIAVKFPNRTWQDPGIRDEIRAMNKFTRAAHIVQVLSRDAINVPNRTRIPRVPHADDSSDEGESSEEEDMDVEEVNPRKRRRELSKQELARKKARWNVPPPPKGPAVSARTFRNPNEKDYLITELFESGDLYNLLLRLSSQGTYIPNRVLWSFWLCLIKACIAMAFPPKKFHPNRRDTPDGELDEIIPAHPQYLRMKRMVHFDIDPLNVLVGDLDPGAPEHGFAPRLKLGDFGLAAEMKTQKRDEYYVNKRGFGKPRFFAPEFFDEDWEFLPAERCGANICEQPIAGNFGPPTNVWAIGQTMHMIITRCWPVQPPLAGYVLLESGGNIISYGAHLTMPGWESVDRDLRVMVARCLCRVPAERPLLRELLDTAEAALRKPPGPGEDDDAIRKWLQDHVFGAPATAQEETTEGKGKEPENAPQDAPQDVPMPDIATNPAAVAAGFVPPNLLRNKAASEPANVAADAAGNVAVNAAEGAAASAPANLDGIALGDVGENAVMSAPANLTANAAGNTTDNRPARPFTI